ncbi:hypothetical protein RQP46_004621 [Phenoliferia psychrophenolica]
MDDTLVCVGLVKSFEASHRHVLSWRSYRDPSLHTGTLIFRFPSPPDDNSPATWTSMESECPHLAAPLEHAAIEDVEDFKVLVCPWHQYDFRLDTGESSTGMKACTFAVQVRGDMLYVEPPGLPGDDYRLLSLRPVSERFASSTPITPSPAYDISSPPKTLVSFCRLILLTSSPLEKVSLTRTLVSLFRSGQLTRISSPDDLPPPDEPPREPTTQVVSLFKTPKRGGGGTIESRAKLLHALAWIELWAIDLAIDICARFAGWKVGSLDGKTGKKLPLFFFSDFLKVAEDEAKHFSLLKARIEEMGYNFGDFPVHNGLWESATDTAGSLFSRLAIIHLVHEARGLDVNPKQIARCRQAGDHASAEVMTTIHNDEVTHVAAGHRHFQYLCQRTEPPLDPIKQFRHEVSTHFHGKLKGPFNEADRAKAGLTGEWYAGLTGVQWDAAMKSPEGRDVPPPKEIQKEGEVGIEDGVAGLKV